MRRTPLALSAVVVALLLGACSTGGAPAPDGAAPPAAETTEDAPATNTNGWTADPACADFVAQRDAMMQANLNQRAEIASIDDLPFSFGSSAYGWDGTALACVWKVYIGDDTEHTAFELLVYAVEGDINYAFASSPDLTASPCGTDDGATCYLVSSGGILAIPTDGAPEGTEAFAGMVRGAGLQALGFTAD